jgi:hypothetical protein
MPPRSRLFWPLAAAALCGCDPNPDNPPAASPTPPRPATGSRFDPTTAGTVRGQVLWQGIVPRIPLLTAALPDGNGGYRGAEKPSPFAPVVDERTSGLAHVVVYLKGIDPEAGRPWDLPPVHVVMTDHRIVVNQFAGPEGRVGVVRRGDEVEMVSADPAHHMLRARGAEFFTLPFPDPDKPLRRRFGTPGPVELTSGAGYYWAAADLFVTDHPYYAVTDREGRFTLPQVPPGKYELVCRVRNWHVAGQDRDPETGLISRRRYVPPTEKRSPVEISPSGSEELSFRFDARDFPANARR